MTKKPGRLQSGPPNFSNTGLPFGKADDDQSLMRMMMMKAHWLRLETKCENESQEIQINKMRSS